MAVSFPGRSFADPVTHPLMVTRVGWVVIRPEMQI